MNEPVEGGIFARQRLEDAVRDSKQSRYRRLLGKWDLLGLGIAAIIGAGIFTGIGNAARAAGPAVIITFVIAGIVCVFTAFAYAELATILPGSGSAYTYVFTSLGRMPAFLTAWLLVLYFVVGNMFIATGWSAYFNAGLDALGMPLPRWLQGSFLEIEGGGFNLPAFVIMTLVTLLVILGIRESVRVGHALVAFKVLIILVFIAIGLSFIRPVNWEPFAPTGFRGVGAAAGAVFFSYVGFEAMTTTAEESRNPRRDLPFAIVGSLVVSMVLFILVAIVLTGMAPAQNLDPSAPLARAFEGRGVGYAGALVTIGALVATTTVLIAFQIALPRVFQAVARDGFLPSRLAEIHARFRTPVPVALVGGLITALGAGLMPAVVVLDLTTSGTLGVYALVCVGVLVLKRTRPDVRRGFRTPWPLPILGALGCAYVFAAGISPLVQLLFVAWVGLGLMLFGFYGHGRLARPARA